MTPRLGIEPPESLGTEWFRLEPLGPEHNERDHAAWSASLAHVAATPGFSADDWAGDTWPVAMSLEDNRADLVQHAREFEHRDAFAYTVLSPGDEVIGCVYIDPDDTGAAQAMVRCWVVADRAELEPHLVTAVGVWLDDDWPLQSVRWPGRDIRRTP